MSEIEGARREGAAHPYGILIVDDEVAILESLELTLGRFSEEGDVDRVLEVLPDVVGRLRELSPLYNEEEVV